MSKHILPLPNLFPSLARRFPFPPPLGLRLWQRCAACSWKIKRELNTRSKNDKGIFPITKFSFDAERNEYICPQGKRYCGQIEPKTLLTTQAEVVFTILLLILSN